MEIKAKNLADLKRKIKLYMKLVDVIDINLIELSLSYSYSLNGFDSDPMTIWVENGKLLCSHSWRNNYKSVPVTKFSGQIKLGWSIV